MSYFPTASWAQTASQAVSASFVIGGTQATYTSSLFGTASWASNSITASFSVKSTQADSASFVVTSSYALTSSVVNGFPFDNVTSTVNVTGSNFTLFQRTTGSFGTSFFDYQLSSGSNQRAGMMFGTWNSSSIFYTEQTTIDIGDTTNVSMSMAVSNSFIQFLAFSQNTINWTVKAFIRYL
jgi:hypothetical protein